MKTIGFIGLGTMGMPMAANLLKKGYNVILYNRTKEKAKEWIEYGAEFANSGGDSSSVSGINHHAQ